MRQVRILVVDDSAYNRRIIREILESDPLLKVVGMASEGAEGLKMALTLAPDLITLDLEMPRMDGFTFLRLLMKQRPTPVVVVSSRRDRENVFHALELGAVDFLAKPSERISPELFGMRSSLLAKARAAHTFNLAPARDPVPSPPAAPLREGAKARLPAGAATEATRAVVLGASTGGPPALQQLLSELPADLAAGVLISQHMPPGFTRSFAERLDRIVPLDVREAQGGERLSAGVVFIAPGGNHLTVERRPGEPPTLALRRPGPRDRYVPSVDLLFTSAAEAFGAFALGAVLTGMGDDGAEGAAEIKRRGGSILAQDEPSSVVFGMPREAIRRGVVDRVVPLQGMSRAILGWAGSMAAEKSA